MFTNGQNTRLLPKAFRESPTVIVANVLNTDNVVGEFKPRSCYYLHFPTNILVKGMSLLITHTHTHTHIAMG